MRAPARDLIKLFILTGILALLLSGFALAADDEAPAEKIKINSLDELPVHSYPLDGTVTELLEKPNQMKALRKQFRADIESDLATYEITDVATLKGIYQNLALLDLAQAEYKSALDHLNRITAMEDKEAARLMGGMTTKAFIAAKDKVRGSATQKEFHAAFARELEVYLFALPYRVVQDKVKADKARAEYLSENLLMGVVQSQIEPAAKAMGGLSSDLAAAVIGIRYALDERLALNPVIVSVYGKYLDANKVEKANIWPQRELILSSEEDLEPIVVGIWDSGVDVNVFKGQMFINENEVKDGTDTDGNGFIDDINGIAYDMNGVANTDMLHPLGDQDGKLSSVFQYMQGFTDMTANVDSPEATAVRTRMKNIPPDQVGDFLTTLGFGGLYMHGTHVGGIAAKDNPFARLLVARIAFDYHPTPQAMTVETAIRMSDGYAATAQYFRDNGVRVVNMSWGWSYKEIEGSLEANGVGANAEDRAAMAKEMIGLLKDGLHRAMVDSPDILFVTAAGNSDNDVEFDVVIPSSFNLPNLMVVGALDQAGDPTGFTSGGMNVRVYANGFQVESFVPGGETMKMSGTSMASPNVCNLAAKLMARKPELKPSEVVYMIENGSDQHPDYPDILRMNGKRSGMLLIQNQE
ncbi:MAG: S8 family serine peptidase [Candidatus Krumholzibacteria bacterium]|nr:S8 family serine peptidase [Candidatus Krumholzibacteria bacterium]